MTILSNFLRLFRSSFLGPGPRLELDDLPGFLHAQRERALFATIFFFILLQGYQTFFRVGLPTTLFVANVVMLTITVTGFLVVLRGRLQGGLLILIYANMAVLFTLQILIIAKAPDFRAPILNALFISLFAVYMLVTAGFFLSRRHVKAIGVLGLVALSASALIVGTRAYGELITTPLAYVGAATVLVVFFVNLFETVQDKLVELTGNLQSQVAERTRALSESEARYRLLLDNASLGIFRTTPDGRILYANETLARLLGFSSAREAMAETRHVSDYYAHPRERDAIVERAKENREPLVRELEFRRRDGSTFLGDFRLRAARDAEGNLEAFEGFVDDITVRRRAEAGIREAMERAEQANRAKSIFLANVSHELRTPLNSIMGFSELLALRHEDRQVKHHAEVIHKAGAGLRALIEDLLDISRIEAGTFAIRAEATDVRAVVEAVGYDFVDAVEVRGLDYTARIAPHVPGRVEIDGKRLRQVLSNLVGNAIKFTASGSITVALEAEPSSRPGEVDLRFRVSDTGCGIAREDQERIFELFYQAEKSSRTGSGLGLAISRQLTHLMGGTIAVESEPGRGSCFTVFFPGLRVLEERVDSPSQDALHSLPLTLRGRCLVVDDLEENRAFIREALSGSLLEIVEAGSGEAALVEVEAARPDVILLDLRLPGIDGYEVLGRLRAREEWSTIPVLAVTASALPDDERRIAEAGFEGLLKKPFSCGQLAASLARILGDRETGSEGEFPGLEDEVRSLDAEDLARLEGAYRVSADSGGVRQAGDLGRLMVEIGKRGERGAVEQAGRMLEASAADFDILVLRRILARLAALFPEPAPAQRG